MSKYTPEPITEKNLEDVQRVIYQFDEKWRNMNPGKSLAWTTCELLGILSWVQSFSKDGRPLGDDLIESLENGCYECIQVKAGDEYVVMKERVYEVKLDAPLPKEISDALRAASNERHSRKNKDE